MNSDPRIKLVERLFCGTGTTYDLIVNLFTCEIDKLWKRNLWRNCRPIPACDRFSSWHRHPHPPDRPLLP